MTVRKILAVRHGVTDWNLESRFQGQLDIPLNAEGRAQAELLARRLKDVRPDAIYSSPLRRAYETTQIIAGGAPFIRDQRLMEIHHGTWQGKTRHEIASEFPDAWQQWDSDPSLFTPEGAESAGQLQRRVSEFLANINERVIICVSHGVVIQMMCTILLPVQSAEARLYPPRNGSVHEFTINRDTVLCRVLPEVINE